MKYHMTTYIKYVCGPAGSDLQSVMMSKYILHVDRDAKKGELVFELYEHINSNEDPQVTLPEWLQEINRGTFAKSRFPLHSNQLLKLYLDLHEHIEEEEQPDDDDWCVDFDDFQASAIEILNGAYTCTSTDSLCFPVHFSISYLCNIHNRVYNLLKPSCTPKDSEFRLLTILLACSSGHQ